MWYLKHEYKYFKIEGISRDDQKGAAQAALNHLSLAKREDRLHEYKGPFSLVWVEKEEEKRDDFVMELAMLAYGRNHVITHQLKATDVL